MGKLTVYNVCKKEKWNCRMLAYMVYDGPCFCYTCSYIFWFFFVSVKIVRATRERLSVPKKDKPTSSSSSSSKKKKAGGWEKKS